MSTKVFVNKAPKKYSIDKTFLLEMVFAPKARKSREAEPPRVRRNPVTLALEWDAMRREGGGKVTKAVLSRRFGVTRARVTQVLNLLRLDPAAQRLILSLGDPLNGTSLTERALRPVVAMNPSCHLEEIRRHVKSIAPK